MSNVTQPNTPTIADRVGQYVMVRDKIAEIKDRHKAELAPYQAALDALNGVLLAHLNQAGGQSFSSAQGTCYRSRKVSVSTADAEAFRGWVISQGAWNLVDWRPNKTAVDVMVDNHEPLPPGVNYSVHYEAGVRRA